MDDFSTRLNQLDCCAVSDAMDRLGLRGVVTGINQYSTQRKIAGRVLTVKLGIDSGKPLGARHLSTTAIEAQTRNCCCLFRINCPRISRMQAPVTTTISGRLARIDWKSAAAVTGRPPCRAPALVDASPRRR